MAARDRPTKSGDDLQRPEAGNDLVRYSRAGDKFHYRWGARRCLRMIDPRTGPVCITVEGSKESRSAGEYVIDLAEYSTVPAGEAVVYYQLKHSTTQVRKEFSLSSLADTLKGFAARFTATNSDNKIPQTRRTFRFVTNRPVSQRLKKTVAAIAEGKKPSAAQRRALEKATKLKGPVLQSFCGALGFIDREGDYLVQKENLRKEVAQFIAGFIDSQEAAELVALVEDRALPKSEDGRTGGRILREDVLKRLGVNSERDLFPAPREIEPLTHVIPREQHDQLVRTILTATKPLIIHAEGGVGKSVVARQISTSLPPGCLAVLYDCFGAGKYRNESEPRHRPDNALVQIANELAKQGLCRTLITSAATPRDALFRNFIERLDEASRSLQEINKSAQLVLLVDAADNAEMAALDNGDFCFASALLRETFPPACRLVALCRTERIALLKPATTIRRLELKPFSPAETGAHLRNRHPEASRHDVTEFHRLTGGNPRVQANAMTAKHKDLPELLATIGPARTTVDEQIADQLDAAINAIRDQHTMLAAAQVESICRGLANLPPFIPLPVLAAAANVDGAAIKSLVADLGRPLWHSDDSVQFRDEPTETWFRNRFSADPAGIAAYAATLEPLANTYTYVAKALPKLWLRAGDHDRLIALALSDDFLPTGNAIDARDIRVYRLQFAFKAALKAGRLADAARLALRAGEEMAGNQRQLDLLAANTDLVAVLQDAHRIQEYAYKKLLRGAWQGSENAYSAALLSSVRDFQGEARGYLRAATRWLHIHFDEREKLRKKQPRHQDKLTTDDIAEMAWSHLNLFGPKGGVKFLVNWRPPETVFKVTMALCSRLVDAGRFDEINELARHGASNPHLIVAVAAQLNAVAKFPPRACLLKTLTALAKKKPAITKPERYAYDDLLTPAILGFAEACAHHRCPKQQIRTVIDRFVDEKADHMLAIDHREHSRRIFFRAAALRIVFAGGAVPEPTTLLPPKPTDKNAPRPVDHEEERNVTQMIGAMLPWFVARAELIARTGRAIDLPAIAQRSESAAAGRHERFDPIPHEVAGLHFELLAFNPKATAAELDSFSQTYLARVDSKFIFRDRVKGTRTAHRQPHLESLRVRLEEIAAASLEPSAKDTPEERSRWFVDVARAVLTGSKADAAAYFESAVEAVAKFGDEMVDRWEGVVSVAARSAANGPRPPEMMHRFVCCGEMIGDMVAREKYWDRDDVFRVALQLDPAGAFGALSRWRERGVGWFSEQVEAFALALAERQLVPPAVAWALSGFKDCNASFDLLKCCLAAEKPKGRQRLFDQYARDFALSGNLPRAVEDATKLAGEHGLDTSRLPPAIPLEIPQPAPAPLDASPVPASVAPKAKKTASAASFFRGIDLLTTGGLARAVRKYDEKPFPKEHHAFWNEVIARVPVGRESEFLRVIVGVAGVNFYYMRHLVGTTRARWGKKAAVKKAWPDFLRAVGKRFAAAFSQRYSFRSWLDDTPMAAAEIELMKAGMVEALGESPDLVSAATFFGFVSTIAPRLTPDEANVVLDFGLARFQLHIEPDFADGPWAPWLQPPAHVRDAFTGFIWSALGAPRASIRWQAAHCVRRLCAGRCQPEIDSLIAWIDRPDLGPFSVPGYPFYRLHAHLYLLIALARAAVDDTMCLQSHAARFARIALDGIPHVLLQKFAAQIALAIERNAAGTYDADVLARLNAVGVSPHPRRRVGRDYTITTPMHERGELRDLKLHFAWDFDRYWFDPLGDVFGLNQNQVMDVAREAAVQFLGIAEDEDFPEDGRQKLWAAQDYYPRGTFHNHSDYPEIDDFRFYYSYHAMFIAAAQLLKEMPVIEHEDRSYPEDLWRDWLRYHDMARADGKWLADRRDPSPTIRRAWTADSDREDWLWRVAKGDFFDVIAHYNPLPHSLCVNGEWTDCDQSWSEKVGVTSAWVRPEMASSLANSLRHAPKAYGAQMPSEGRDNHHEVEPFDLIAWIRVHGGTEFRLDRFDPYAKNIVYPPNVLARAIVEQWQLRSDAELCQWYQPNSTTPIARDEIWSEEISDPRERPFRKGERLCVTVDFLRQMSAALGRHLLVAVEIERQYHTSYRSTGNEYGGYPPPSHKVFLLTPDGILHDAAEDHQLG